MSGSDSVTDAGEAGNGGAGGSGGMPAEAATPEGSLGNDASDAADAKSIMEAGPPLRPTGVTIATQTMATQLEAPSNGGNVISDSCPANQVLVGFKGTVDSIDGGQSLLRSVQGICAPLTVTAAAPYQVKVGTGASLPARNTLGAVSVSAICPADQVVTGFSGRYAQFIQSLDFICAPLLIGGSSPTFTLSLGTATTTSIIGVQSGTVFSTIGCANNDVAVGQAPHAGADVDAFGLLCAAPSLTVQ
jgi:hypothetical protein